jgi:hypothetical protein
MGKKKPLALFLSTIIKTGLLWGEEGNFEVVIGAYLKQLLK